MLFQKQTVLSYFIIRGQKFITFLKKYTVKLLLKLMKNLWIKCDYACRDHQQDFWNQENIYSSVCFMRFYGKPSSFRFCKKKLGAYCLTKALQDSFDVGKPDNSLTISKHAICFLRTMQDLTQTCSSITFWQLFGSSLAYLWKFTTYDTGKKANTKSSKRTLDKFSQL